MAEELLVNIVGDTSKLKGALDKASGSMTSFATKAAAAGKGLVIAGGLITAAFGLTVKAAIGFNKEMANIATLIPGSTKRVNELKSAIRTMAVEVGKDTTDLAQGAYQVISAFGDTADTVKILGIAAKAATAGVATTTDAINLLSAVTKGYGDTSSEAVQKVSDLAFQTVTLGQTTFPELASSIGRVTPLAASLGVEAEELFAVMATGTGVTGGAAEVATQLRGVFQSLMSPTKDMTDLIEDLGYKSGEAMLQELGLGESLDAIAKAAEDSEMPLKQYISSIEGQTLALALTGSQADTYTEKLTAMRDATGLTDIAFKEQTEGVNKAGFAFQQAKIQISVLVQEIGDRLLPMLVPVLKKFTEIIGKIREWTKAHEPLMDWIVRISATLGIMAAVGGTILLAASAFLRIKSCVDSVTFALKLLNTKIGITGALTTGTLIPSLIKLKASLGLLGTIATGPIGLLILAVGGLYLAWVTNFGGMRDYTIEVIDKIKGLLKSLRDSFDETTKSFTNFSEGIISGGGGAAGAFAEDADDIVEKTEEVTESFDDLSTATNRLDEISNILQPAREAIQEILDTMTPYEKQLRAINERYDEAIEKIKTYITDEKELKVAIEELNEGRIAEITLLDRQKTALEEAAVAKERLAELTKDLTDKIWEFTATEEEIKLRDINREYDLLIENAKEVFKGKEELIEVIKKINEERQEEIDTLDDTASAAKKLADATKSVTDRILEITDPLAYNIQQIDELAETWRLAGVDAELIAEAVRLLKEELEEPPDIGPWENFWDELQEDCLTTTEILIEGFRQFWSDFKDALTDAVTSLLTMKETNAQILEDMAEAEADYLEEMADLQEDYQKIVSDGIKEIAKLQDDYYDDVTEAEAGHLKKVTKLQKDYNKMVSKGIKDLAREKEDYYDDLEALERRYNRKISDGIKDLARENEDYDIEMRRLTEDRDEAAMAGDDERAEYYQEKMEDCTLAHTRAVEDMTEKQAELTEDHGIEVDKMEEDHKETMEAMIEKQKEKDEEALEKIQDVKDDHEEKMADMEEKHKLAMEAMIEKQNEEAANALENIEDVKEDHADLMDDMEEDLVTVKSIATDFWDAIKKAAITALADMIVKQVISAFIAYCASIPFGWLVFIAGIVAVTALAYSLAAKNLGGEVEEMGKSLGGAVKMAKGGLARFAGGGLGTDTVPIWATPGEYVVAKPMTDFIKRFRTIPESLMEAIAMGAPTPVPAFAGGGQIGNPNITAAGFGETRIYIDIHDNRISDEIDIKRLAITVGDEMTRRINARRRY